MPSDVCKRHSESVCTSIHGARYIKRLEQRFAQACVTVQTKRRQGAHIPIDMELLQLPLKDSAGEESY